MKCVEIRKTEARNSSRVNMDNDERKFERVQESQGGSEFNTLSIRLGGNRNDILVQDSLSYANK